jgi:DNA modification methylase
MKPYYEELNITIYNGDCLKMMHLITDNCIVVTDPPFNIGYHYDAYSDSMKTDEYYEMLQSIFQDYPFVVIHYPEEIYKISFQVGKFPSKVISWVYNSNTAKQHRDIAFFDVEPDMKKYGQDYKNPTDKRIAKRILEGKRGRLYDWWNINQIKNVSKSKTEHPCQMPLEVMTRVVAILPERYTIVDPFLGSGTTARACKDLGRKCIGIEISQKYCDIAVKRLGQEVLF